MPLTRLVLADDHPIVLKGLSDLFDADSGFQVDECCTTGGAALAAVRRHRPDVLVLDLLLPDQNGLTVLQILKRESLPTRAVLLSAFLDDDAVVEAVRLGAAGIVLKDSPPSDLVACVHRVAAGERWFDGGTLAGTLDRAVRQHDAWRHARVALTEREIEIVRMVARGMRNKAIADALALSEGTVKVHVHNVYRKLDVSNRVELTRFAQQSGLL
jgi:DNA-binding NarL/FixJ family response regulator